jgi:hypothetical protein
MCAVCVFALVFIVHTCGVRMHVACVCMWRAYACGVRMHVLCVCMWCALYEVHVERACVLRRAGSHWSL